MPNPCIIWGAWIFPVTINKDQPSISPRMNHVLTGSPTSARLFLPTSLTFLKYYSPPSVKSQDAFWQRQAACLSNICSESEMSCQSPTKAAPPLCVLSSQENTRSKTHEARLGIRWPSCVPAANTCRHLRLCLSLSCPQCHLTRVTYPAPIRLSLGWASVLELAQAPAQAPASTPSQNWQDGSLPTPSVYLH